MVNNYIIKLIHCQEILQQIVDYKNGGWGRFRTAEP